MKIGNIFTRFAKSKTGQKIYKKLLDPKSEDFLNNTLPLIECTTVSAFYVASTAVQKKIDDDSKKALQIQNILSWIVSIGLSMPLNKKVTKAGEGIIKHLKPELMQDAHKVIDGIKVGLPMLNSLLISRFLVAVALVPLSSKIRDHVKSKQQPEGQKKVDIIA